VIKSLLVFMIFVVLMDAYYGAFKEVSGLKVADHAVSSCPILYAGFITGVLSVGLVWYSRTKL